eukprot:1139752-Pelagomonas_calceolata.AAC.1
MGLHRKYYGFHVLSCLPGLQIARVDDALVEMGLMGVQHIKIGRLCFLFSAQSFGVCDFVPR